MNYKKPANFLLKLSLYFIALSFIVQRINGYRQMYDNDILKKMKTIIHHPDASIEDRYAQLFGIQARYLFEIKRLTPDTSIILLPDIKVLQARKKTSKLAGKRWANYFLYPRKVVYFNERKYSPFYDDIDYVVIIDSEEYGDFDGLNTQNAKHGLKILLVKE